MPPPQKTNAPTEQHVIASPNPSIDDSKTPATAGPKQVETRPIRPADVTTQAPMKTTSKSKSKSKHRQTKPRT